MDGKKIVIRSIRKGSAQWSEEDRLQLAALLIKAGYTVRIGRIMNTTQGKTPKAEYVVEAWEGADT